MHSAWTELAREEQNGTFNHRCGAITPDGIIDEDFEDELGSPSQVIQVDCIVVLWKKLF